MKRVLAVAAAALALTFSSVVAMAKDTTIQGTVSGYMCVVLGKACPVDREDPVIAAERLFVVAAPDGSYYMIPNLDRAILARHLTEKVRVTGNLDEKYRSMKADKLEVYQGADKWKTVWDLAMQHEEERRLMGGD